MADDDETSNDENVSYESGGEHKKSLGSSLMGAVIGFLLIPLGFFILYKSATYSRSSEAIGSAKMISVSQAPNEKAGSLVKFSGKAEGGFVSDAEFKVGESVYIKRSAQECKEIEKEKKEDTGRKNAKGEKIYKVTKYKEYEWGSSSRSMTFAPIRLKMGNLDVAAGSLVEFKLADKPLIPATIYEPATSTTCTKATVGASKIDIKGISKDQELFVTGVINGNVVSGSDKASLIISAGTAEQTMGAVKSEEKATFWITIVLAWLCFTFSVVLILGPLTFVFEKIPLVGEYLGGGVSFIAGLIAGVIAVPLVFVFYGIVYFLANFWWIALIAVAGGIGFLIYSGRKKQAAA